MPDLQSGALPLGHPFKYAQSRCRPYYAEATVLQTAEFADSLYLGEENCREGVKPCLLYLK